MKISQSIYSNNKKIVAHSFKPSSPIHKIEKFNVSENYIEVTTYKKDTPEIEKKPLTSFHEISRVKHTGTEKEIRTFVFENKEYALIKRKDTGNIIKEINKESSFGIYICDNDKKYGIGRYAETNLRNFLRKYDIPLKHKLYLMRVLLNDYARLHKQGRIHCDIKLDNVLISKHHSGRRYAGIIDLGTSQRLNNPHPIVGTADNIPPEVYKMCVSSDRVLSNTAIDVWGIGTMFIQIITKKALNNLLHESFGFDRFKKPNRWSNEKWSKFRKCYDESCSINKKRLMYHLLNTNYVNFYYSNEFKSPEGTAKFLKKLGSAIKEKCLSDEAKKVIDIIIPCLNFDPKKRPSLDDLSDGLDSLIDPNRQKKKTHG